MTSRERVTATLEGKPVDRVASDFRAETEVFEKLQNHLGLETVEDVLLWTKSDFRDMCFLFNDGGYGGYSSFGWKDKEIRKGIYEDLWGVRRRAVQFGEGSYLDIERSPLKGKSGIDALRKYSFPDPAGIYDFSSLRERIREVNKREDYFILMEGESLFDRCWAMRGIEDFMVDLLNDDEAARYIIEGNYRFFHDYTKMILESAGGGVDAIGMYDDFGNQRGMMISPELYRKYFKEYQRRYIEMVKRYGAYVFYHSCGGITGIIEDLIEIGVDILDPLQLNAMGLSSGDLADLCGGRVTFHGGIDLQDLMTNGTPDQVNHAIDNLKHTLGRFGKYILSCSHLIQVDVPVRNIEMLVRCVN